MEGIIGVAPPYASFTELAQHEEQGFDFLIRQRPGTSDILVMAPHGGGIEPGTGDIADALAGGEHALYCFKGLKKSGNRGLHLTSIRFNEPLALQMLGRARQVLTVHGCRDTAPAVWVGGRDLPGGESIIAALKGIDIPADRCSDPALRGLQPDNVCNRGSSRAGLQLEISRGLREMLFADLLRRPLRRRTPLFYRLVAAIRGCLGEAPRP